MNLFITSSFQNVSLFETRCRYFVSKTFLPILSAPKSYTLKHPMTHGCWRQASLGIKIHRRSSLYPVLDRVLFCLDFVCACIEVHIFVKKKLLFARSLTRYVSVYVVFSDAEEEQVSAVWPSKHHPAYLTWWHSTHLSAALTASRLWWQHETHWQTLTRWSQAHRVVLDMTGGRCVMSVTHDTSTVSSSLDQDIRIVWFFWHAVCGIFYVLTLTVTSSNKNSVTCRYTTSELVLALEIWCYRKFTATDANENVPERATQVKTTLKELCYCDKYSVCWVTQISQKCCPKYWCQCGDKQL